MKLDKDALLAQLQTITRKLQGYAIFIFIVAFAGLYAFLVVRINSLTQSEPTAVSVSDKQKVIKSLKIDEASIAKMLELRDQNVEVEALFEGARNNPFNEE